MSARSPHTNVDRIARAIEVAAEARYEWLRERLPDREMPDWADLSPPVRSGYLEDARINIEAALPVLAAATEAEDRAC